MEAITLFAAATVILSIFMIYFGSQISTRAQQRELDSLKGIADTIRQEISIARQAGPGYSRTFEIPARNGYKNISLTVVSSSDYNSSTELIVKFDPPIANSIEASQVLGTGVYGMLSGGTNTIRTYDGGIIVEPDKSEQARIFDQDTSMRPEAVFATLPDHPKLSGPIECSYGIENHWISAAGTFLSPSEKDRVAIFWNATTPDGDHACIGEKLDYGQPALLSHALSATSVSSSIKRLFAPGSNLTCTAVYSTDMGVGSSYIPCGSGSSTGTGAVSNEVTIANSLPIIEMTGVHVGTAHSDSSKNTTTWSSIKVTFRVSDPDPGDTGFNVSLVKDGTNAGYIDCPNCESNNQPAGNPLTFPISATIPWPYGGSCSDINGLSFKLRAIENDSSEGLYTLQRVDVSNELTCPPGTMGGP